MVIFIANISTTNCNLLNYMCFLSLYPELSRKCWFSEAGSKGCSNLENALRELLLNPWLAEMRFICSWPADTTWG